MREREGGKYNLQKVRAENKCKYKLWEKIQFVEIHKKYKLWEKDINTIWEKCTGTTALAALPNKQRLIRLYFQSFRLNLKNILTVPPNKIPFSKIG